jgi:hypothetical protein
VRDAVLNAMLDAVGDAALCEGRLKARFELQAEYGVALAVLALTGGGGNDTTLEAPEALAGASHRHSI